MFRFFPRRIKAAFYSLRARLLSRGLSRRVVRQPSATQASSAAMSIVIPIHDAPQVTRRCLASIERDARQAEVILVDDGSRLAETTQLVQEFGERNGWRIVRNQEPSGHSAACASGTRFASRPYLCLLNSDTVITRSCWKAIQDAFEGDPTIGIAGPSTSSSGNEQTLDLAVSCRLYWNDNQISAFAARLTEADLQPAIFDLPWISGFALFIRRGLWDELGGFDQKNLPGYLNDIELCRRVANLGYRTVWVRNAYIHHLGSQSYKPTLAKSEIESRLLARLQYIRDKHKWDPPVNAGYTKIVRSRDGKTWALRCNHSSARG
jgi:GT2 family glycosyltransferase